MSTPAGRSNWQQLTAEQLLHETEHPHTSYTTYKQNTKTSSTSHGISQQSPHRSTHPPPHATTPSHISNPYHKRTPAHPIRQSHNRSSHNSTHTPTTHQTKRHRLQPPLQQTYITDHNASPHHIDNHPWGDDFDMKHENSFRIAYQNVNGLNIKNEEINIKKWSEIVHLNEIDALAMVETNIAWNKPGIWNKVYQQLKTGWTNHQLRMETANSSKSFETDYQPGGALQTVGGNWTSRCCQTDKDKTGMGRWATITLQGSQGRVLHLITAYQVCNQNHTGGTKRAWDQQAAILQDRDQTEVNPRKSFQKDFTNYILDLTKNEDNLVLIQIDANCSLHAHSSWLQQFVSQTGLADIHMRKHGVHHEPPTYKRGRKRIDYMLCSPVIIAFIDTCGILAFDEDSDHRMLWVDIRLHQLLRCQDPPPDLLLATGRKQHSSQKKRARQYVEKFKAHMTEHNVFHRWTKLGEDIQKYEGPLKPVDLQTLHNIDNTITEGMMCSTVKSRQNWTTPHSPKLMKAKALISYWKAWQSELLTSINHSKSRHRARHTWGEKFPISIEQEAELTLSMVKHSMRAAIKQFQQVRKNAEWYRWQFLWEQEDIHKQASKPDKVRAVRIIRNAELSRKLWPTIKRIAKKNSTGGLQYIKVPNNDPHTNSRAPWTEIRDPAQMTEKLLQRNLSHFGQANGTPFSSHASQKASLLPKEQAIPILQNEIGDNQAAADILEELSKHLEPPTNLNGLLSTDELISGFKRWKESTTTSPSGRNLSLYKSFLSAEYDDCDPNRPSPGPKFSETIFGLMSEMVNICVTRGVILPRWKTIINLMLQKIPGNPMIHKLRVIHIFEADLNLWTGIVFGRRVLRQLIQLNMLGEEQCGSVPGRSTLDVSAVRKFSLEISRLTRTDIAIFDNDAKACYDRIVMAVFYLRSKQIGMHDHSHQFMNSWLNESEYYLKTQMGISTETYQSTVTNLLHGPGQGGKASPAIWAVVSALLFRCMTQKCPGATFTDPDNLLVIKHLMQAFVDDSTIWTNDFMTDIHTLHSDPTAIIHSLQTAAQYWEQLLYASGGSLELTKCFYYILSWKFDKEGNPKHKTLEEINQQISITRSENQTEVPIKALESHELIKTLGLQDNILGNSNSMYQQNIQKSTTLATIMRGYRLHEHETWRLYHAVYLKRMTFGMEISSFTEKQLRHIQVPMKTAMLHSLGYSSMLPLPMVYAPQRLGGVGLQHLYMSQGSSQIMFCLRFLRHPSHTLAKYTRTLLRWYQHIAGITQHVLEAPEIDLSYMPTGWIPVLRHFLAATHSSLYIPGEHQDPRPTKYDQRIMDQARDYTTSTSELKAINRVRLYMQVTFVSNITQPGTNCLYKMNNRDCIPSHSIKKWPRQPRPGPRSWTMWNKFIANHLCRGGKDRRLRTPVGEYCTHDKTRIWNTVYCQDTNQVYHCTPDNDEGSAYDIHAVQQRTRRSMILGTSTSQTTEYPMNCIPITIESPNRSSTAIRYTAPAAPPSPTSFTEYIDALPAWERALLANATPSQSSIPLQQHLATENELFFVSDGGTNQIQGSFGWVLSDGHAILWQCDGPVQGWPMTSFRAESTGRLSAFLFLHHFITFHQPTILDHSILKTWCDSTSVLQTEKRYSKYPDITATPFTEPDFDLTWTIISVTRNLPFKIISKWVAAHQDDNHELHQLPHEAILNIEADKLATIALQREIILGSQPFRPIAAMTYLRVNDTTITSAYRREIETAYTRPRLRKYTLQKRKWKALTYDTVHWAAHKLSRQGTSGAKLRFLTSVQFEWLPTMSRLPRRPSNITQVSTLSVRNRNIRSHTPASPPIRHSMAHKVPTSSETIPCQNSDIVTNRTTGGRWHDEIFTQPRHTCNRS